MMNANFRNGIVIASLAIIISTWGRAQDSVQMTKHIAVYLEIYGHNYLSYKESLKPSTSINAGYRFQLKPTNFFVFSSLGWGAFSEINSKQWTHFIPIELTFQFGGEHHFVEIGGAFVKAWGEHRIEYSGSQGSGAVRQLSDGTQYVFKIGYAWYSKNGIMFRFAVSPHFYDRSLNAYDNKIMDKGIWIPIGISAGYCF